MPSVISKPTRKPTSANFSPTETAAVSVRLQRREEKPFTVAACDRLLKKYGFRSCTPEESRTAREAIARSDAKIAQQAAAAGMTVEEFHRSFLPQ